MAEHVAARAAVVEVALDVRVTVKLEAEGATEAELARLVQRDPAGVRGAIVARVGQPWASEKAAGWLDENREAFVTEITLAESGIGAGLEVVR